MLTRGLHLRGELLGELTTDELRSVAGGYTFRGSICLSACVGCPSGHPACPPPQFYTEECPTRACN